MNKKDYNDYRGQAAGQALLELAVFGSLIIMLLGILINYGMRYNYQQQVSQQAFRKAMASSANALIPGKPISESEVVLSDKHIPDPSNPWGVGSVMPFSSSAGVTRNWKQNETADTESELPQVNITVQGGQTRSFKAAGFREDDNVSEGNLDKYRQIYGDTVQGCFASGADGKCTLWGNIYDSKGDVVNNILKTCIQQGPLNPVTNAPTCLAYAIAKIRFIDSNAGEIMNYGSAVTQCRQIVDQNVCAQECNRQTYAGDPTNCLSICQGEVKVPWYCQGYAETDSFTHKYDFPVLNRLFSVNSARNAKSMGLQQDYNKTTDVKNKLAKEETTSAIKTEDTTQWEDVTKRLIIFRPYNDTSGATQELEVDTDVSQSDSKIRQTPW